MKTILKAFVTCYLSLLLISCASLSPQLAEPNPAVGTKVEWPGVAYDEVRAYCYDYTKEMSPTFLDLNTGHMHVGVMDPRGTKMTPAQVSRLMESITVSQPKGKRTPCYAPHHAFVFFNHGKPVAVFEMCFGCNRHRSYPAGAPEYVNRADLYDLCHELDLPVGVGNKFYTDACNSRRIRR